MSNAAKFTQRGKIEIRSEIGRRRPPSGVEVLFSVRDTGIGMSEEVLAKIFKPFTQAPTHPLLLKLP